MVLKKIKILIIIFCANVFNNCISDSTSYQGQENRSSQKQIEESQKYKISIEQNNSQYGSIKANASSASEGDSVILTINPILFYKTKSIIVKDDDLAEIQVVPNGSNWSFPMPPSNVTVTAEFEQMKPFLGGGYQNAKWGMSVNQVKAALSSNRVKFDREARTDDGDRVLLFTIDNQKVLKCFFYKDKFYHTEYDPKFSLSEEDIALSVVNELKSKYGNGYTYRTMDVFVTRLITECEDIETKIIHRISDKEIMGYNVSGSVIIAYLGKAITVQKSADNERLKAEKERAENEAKQKKLRGVGGDL